MYDTTFSTICKYLANKRKAKSFLPPTAWFFGYLGKGSTLTDSLASTTVDFSVITEVIPQFELSLGCGKRLDFCLTRTNGEKVTITTPGSWIGVEFSCAANLSGRVQKLPVGLAQSLH